MNRPEESKEVPEHFSSEVTNSWISSNFDLSAASHQGHVRENNEDRYLAVRFGRSLESVSTNIDQHLLEKSYIFTGYGMLVADGIGGLDLGEVASSTALIKLVELILDTPDWTLALKRERDVRTVLQRMTQRFLQIDETLRESLETFYAGDPANHLRRQHSDICFKTNAAGWRCRFAISCPRTVAR